MSTPRPSVDCVDALVSADIPAVVALLNLLPRGLDDPPWYRDDLRTLVRDRVITSFVARANGRPVGIVVAATQREAYDIIVLGVDPDWQGQGVGRRLVRKLAQKCSPRYPCVRAVVREGDLALLKFFRATWLPLRARLLRNYYRDLEGRPQEDGIELTHCPAGAELDI